MFDVFLHRVVFLLFDIFGFTASEKCVSPMVITRKVLLIGQAHTVVCYLTFLSLGNCINLDFIVKRWRSFCHTKLKRM
jgi:hypothetical protein